MMQIKSLSLPTTSQADALAKLEALCKSDLFLLESRRNRVLRVGRISKNTHTHEKIKIVSVGDSDIAKVMHESSKNTQALLKRHAKKSVEELATFLSVNQELKCIVEKKIAEVANTTCIMCDDEHTKRRATSMGSSKLVGYFLSIVDKCIEQHATILNVKKKLTELMSTSEETKTKTVDALKERDSTRDELKKVLENLKRSNDAKNAYKVDIDRLTREIDQLKTERATIAPRCKEFEAKLRELRSEWSRSSEHSRKLLGDANASLESLHAKMNEVKKTPPQSNEDVARLNEEIVRLRKELDATRRDRDDALQAAFKANADHATTIETSKKISEATRAEISALKSRISALKRRNEEFMTQRVRVDEQHRRKMDENCERVKSLTKEIQDLKQTASHREQRLDMLLKRASDGDRSFEEVFQEEFTAMREAYESQISQLRLEREKDRVKSRVSVRDLERAHDETTRSLKREVEDLRFKVQLLRSKLGTYDTTYADSAGDSDAASERTGEVHFYTL